MLTTEDDYNVLISIKAILDRKKLDEETTARLIEIRRLMENWWSETGFNYNEEIWMNPAAVNTLVFNSMDAHKLVDKEICEPPNAL